MARLLPARSMHLSAANVHRSGIKELSGPTKGATVAACRPVPEGRNGGNYCAVIEAHCYALQCREIDCEQLHSSIA